MTSIQLSTAQWSSIHNKIHHFHHCKISAGSSDSMIPLGILPSTSTTNELRKPGRKTDLMAPPIAMKVARWMCVFHLNQPSLWKHSLLMFCYCGVCNQSKPVSETSKVSSKHHAVMQNKTDCTKWANWDEFSFWQWPQLSFDCLVYNWVNKSMNVGTPNEVWLPCSWKEQKHKILENWQSGKWKISMFRGVEMQIPFVVLSD